MNLFHEKNKEPNLRAIWGFAVLTLLCFVALILFAISNAHWIPVHIPNFPWRAEPVLYAFETPLFFAMLVCFLVGIAISLLVGIRAIRQMTTRHAILETHIKKLESALDKTHRLISTTQQKND